MRTGCKCRPSRISPSRALALDTVSVLFFLPKQPELARVARRLLQAEMLERGRGEQPPARRALQQTLLDQERLDDVLDGDAWLAQCGRHGVDADRAAAITLRDGHEVTPVHGVEPGGIDFQLTERVVGDLAVDRLGTIHMGEVAHPAQQTPGDTRRAARAARRVSPGVCCAGCATSPMWMVPRRSTARSPTTRSVSWKSMPPGSTPWTGVTS